MTKEDFFNQVEELLELEGELETNADTSIEDILEIPKADRPNWSMDPVCVSQPGRRSDQLRNLCGTRVATGTCAGVARAWRCCGQYFRHVL